VVALLAWLLLAPPASAATTTRPGGRELLAALASRDSARTQWVHARWRGSLASLRAAQQRLDRASDRYGTLLDQSVLPSAIAARDRNAWSKIAMDLAERGSWTRALALLRGPLGSPATLLPVEALAAGRVESPGAALGILGFGPGQAPHGARDLDEAALYVASAISDSAGLARSSRAARWLLLVDSRRPATARSWARASLARSLAGKGERRLARAILARATGRTTAETLLLSDLTAATGDTLPAVRLLVAIATRGDLPTSDRYPAAKKASAWLQGSAADSLNDKEWMGYLHAFSDVGEASLALHLLDTHKKPAPDAATQSERDDFRASLFYKARRYDAAATAYRAQLRKPRPVATRADPALGLARAYRSQHLFAAADSAFVLATSLDSAGTVREAAAWERAREWEDQKPPRESALVLRWARARIKTEPNATTARVHEAIQWIRADSLAAADSVLMGPAPESDARVYFWRGWVASARGDSTRAREAYRRAWEADPWSYEGVRAREISGLPIDPTQGVPLAKARHGVRPVVEPPLVPRVLDAVGFHDLALDLLRSCATGEGEPRANGCIDALETRGIYRVGRSDLNLDLRLRFPPASAGPVFRAAEEETLSAPFLWSIMRQESGYLPTARSRAGALGLLQLMTPTASRLARRPLTESEVLDPDLNVRLGAMYLRQLVREFGDLRPVAASYNGGEDNVRRWIAARPRLDDLWVELIPYWETRGYVKQTYAAMRRYEAVYDASPPR